MMHHGTAQLVTFSPQIETVWSLLAGLVFEDGFLGSAEISPFDQMLLPLRDKSLGGSPDTSGLGTCKS